MHEGTANRFFPPASQAENTALLERSEASQPALAPPRGRVLPAAHGPEIPHILYIIDRLLGLGGGERALLEIVRRLAPARFRCSIVTFQVNPDFRALKDIACPLHILPLQRTYDLNAMKMAFRLQRLIRQENVSVVHTFFQTADLWAGPIAKLSGWPVIVSSRRDMGIFRDWKHRFGYPLVNPIFDRVLAVSDEVRSYCLNHDGLPSERVETLYNGVDLSTVLAKTSDASELQRLGVPSGAPVISTVANIRPVKGIDVLVRAAAHVCREFPNAVFLVAGDVLVPETFAELKALVESLGLANNVRFVGKQLNPYPILRASRVFCLPSRNEGFSNALIEAMGCGLPCVATRVGGNAEALDDGRSGYIVASEDAEVMADRILRLLREPEAARKMGETAREAAEQRFSIGAMMTRLMAIYDELLAARNA